MHRKPSPIRHDYNLDPPASRNDQTAQRRLLWFGAGLGLPLCAVLLGILFRSETPQDAPISVEQRPVPSVASAPETQPALVADEPVAEDLAPRASSTPQAPAYDEIVLRIASGDTLDSLFRKHKLNIADLLTIAGLDAAKRPLRVLKPGDELTVRHEEGRVLALSRNLTIDSALQVVRDDAGQFSAELVERPVEYRQTLRHGVIDTSLFESAAAGGMSDRVIMNIAGIFAWDIDFVYDIRRGDEYYVIYEELWQDGEKVADGEIVAAEFVNQGESYQALRYVSPDGDTDYFNPDGRSVRKAFVRAPVDFRRISSAFNPNRRHPILNTIRAHRGVDYSAAAGTPIMAAGDGKIIFRGTQRGYGKVVILQHGGNITTLYAHMRNFRKGQRVGTRVKQGETIGFVGKTGLATAPHLHYEYRLNGVHRNPRTVPLPQASPIKDEYLADFQRVSAPVLA
ncbi:MAG: peptidoglycan DD-metalloendopeptidase family protein, partial [Pseudomonadota bacterium]